jgi:hypothetical protein
MVSFAVNDSTQAENSLNAMQTARKEYYDSDSKSQSEHLDHIKDVIVPVLKSNFDELGLWATAWKFKKVGKIRSMPYT